MNKTQQLLVWGEDVRNLEAVFDHVEYPPEKIRLFRTNNEIRIKFSESVFDSISLVKLISNLKRIIKRYHLMGSKIRIVIDLGEVSFKDKITYLLLESIVLHLCENYAFHLYLSFKVSKNNAIHNGLKHNSIINGVNPNSFVNRELYIKHFYRNHDGLRLYRRYITKEEMAINKKIPSNIGSDVFFLLSNSFEDEAWIGDISEAITELVDNAAAHSNGDVLLDIDICDARLEESKLKIVNIAVINLNEQLLYSGIMQNLKSEKYSKDDELYSKIYCAYENHKEFFNEIYSEQHYFMITAFQNHVTSREFYSGSNGTGLTKLIDQILSTTIEIDYSYVLSGRHLLFSSIAIAN